MAASCIPGGSGLPEGATALAAAPVPYREWHIGRYGFRRARRQGLWTCQVTDAGAIGYRTPLGAFLAARRAAGNG
jgi:hypothetical protein